MIISPRRPLKCPAKCESPHALRRFLFFANEGEVRRRQPDEQLNQASCLNLVVNAVVAWNTVYMAVALQQVRTEEQTVREDDVRHLAPTRYGHVNPYGTYHFEVDGTAPHDELRPLRRASR